MLSSPWGQMDCIHDKIVLDLLQKLDAYKSMELDGLHPRVLRKLEDVVAKPLSIILRQSWLSGNVPLDWRLANVTLIFKKGRKDDPGSYRPISLSSVLGEVMERIISGAIMDQLKVNQGIRPSQHGFTNGTSSLINLISFYNKVNCLVDEGKTVDVIYLDFSGPIKHQPGNQAQAAWVYEW